MLKFILQYEAGLLSKTEIESKISLDNMGSDSYYRTLNDWLKIAAKFESK